MEKKVFCLIVLLIVSLTFVSSENGWDDFGDDSSVDNSNKDSTDDSTNDSSPFDEGSLAKYNSNFYIALGLGAVGLLIIFYLLRSILVKPKNKW